MSGTVILSHGTDSGPDAIKVSELAKIAEDIGWKTRRPDFRDEDRLGHAGSVGPRIEKLVAVAREVSQPLVLAGSSMGAFVSGLASLQVSCAGVFLIALPIEIPQYPRRFDLARVPATIVHGFDDELCPAADAVRFAAARRIPTLLLPDDHRLANHVEAIGREFRFFLARVSAGIA